MGCLSLGLHFVSNTQLILLEIVGSIGIVGLCLILLENGGHEEDLGM